MSASCCSRLDATRSRFHLLGILGMVISLNGCGCGSAVVSGKVRYKGQILTTGEVSLVAADGKSRSGLIGTDGSYEVSDAPMGPVTIVVVARKVEGGPSGGSPLVASLERSRRPVVKSLVPARFGGPDTSGLKFEVVAGAQTKDIDLND